MRFLIYHTDWKNPERVEAKLSTLKDLMKIAEKEGEIIIKFKPEGPHEIEIYDDYRE